CRRIVYLANGRIVVQGSAQDVARQSALIVFEASGDAADDAARRLRRMPGVAAAAVSGRAVRAAGTGRCAPESSIGTMRRAALSWHEVEPRLEDVFIHMLAVHQGALRG